MRTHRYFEMKKRAKILSFVMAAVMAVTAIVPSFVQNSSVAEAKEALAQKSGQSITVVTCTGSGVNIRKGAGTTYGVAGTANKNEVYRYIGSAADSSGKIWYKIQIGADSKSASARYGYIRYDYAKKSTAQWAGWLAMGSGTGAYVRAQPTSGKKMDTLASYSVSDMYVIGDASTKLWYGGIETQPLVLTRSGLLGYVDYWEPNCNPWYAWARSESKFGQAIAEFTDNTNFINGKHSVSSTCYIKHNASGSSVTLRSYPTTIANSSGNVVNPKGATEGNKYTRSVSTLSTHLMTGFAYCHKTDSIFYNIQTQTSDANYKACKTAYYLWVSGLSFDIL